MVVWSHTSTVLPCFGHLSWFNDGRRDGIVFPGPWECLLRQSRASRYLTPAKQRHLSLPQPRSWSFGTLWLSSACVCWSSFIGAIDCGLASSTEEKSRTRGRSGGEKRKEKKKKEKRMGGWMGGNGPCGKFLLGTFPIVSKFCFNPNVLKIPQWPNISF